MTARRWVCVMSLAPLVGGVAVSCTEDGAGPATTQSISATTMAVAPTTRRGPTVRPSEARAFTITGVEGIAQVRESPDAPWQKAVVGMNVTEGAEFRTGPKSAVRVLIPPDRTITLDRPGVIKLKQAIQQGSPVETMPYGRTRYDIEEAGIEHQAELVSPSSTLGIRK